MKTLLPLFFIFTTLFTYAQVNIKGTVTDAASNQKLQYATVRLMNIQDSSLVQGAITDEKGKFILQNISYSTYNLLINFVGYQSYSSNLVLNANNKTITLQIKLKQSQTQLGEIVVKAKHDRIEELVNKTVFRPDSLDLKSSSNALDVLKKVPGVVVNEMSKSIRLIGEKNVLVLINGIARQSNFDLLTVKPEDIDRIEVISNPSAKYDAEYTGVINVILKKKNIHGFTASVWAVYVYRLSAVDVGLEYYKKKIRFFGSYYFENTNLQNRNPKKPVYKSSEYRESVINDQKYLYNNENFLEDFKQNKHNYRFGFDYFINDKNTINLTLYYNTFNKVENSITNSNNSVDGNLVKSYLIHSDYFTSQVSQNYTVFYKREFKDPEQELTIDINYYTLYRTDDDKYIDSIFNNLNKLTNAYSRNTIETNNKNSLNLKIDYIQPVSDKFSLDAGYKLYLRTFDNNFSYTADSISDFFLTKQEMPLM